MALAGPNFSQNSVSSTSCSEHLDIQQIYFAWNGEASEIKSSFSLNSMAEPVFLDVQPDDDVLWMYMKTNTMNMNGDSGYDLYCPKDVTIDQGCTAFLDLRVRVRAYYYRKTILEHIIGPNLNELPEINRRYTGYWLCPRSSNSRTGLIMVNSVGVIDSGYTGSLKAAFYNSGPASYTVRRGDRLVQVVGPAHNPLNHRVVRQISMNTERGDRGFGSTTVCLSEDSKALAHPLQ